MKKFILAFGCSLLLLLKCTLSQDIEPGGDNLKNEARALVIAELAKNFKPDTTVIIMLNVPTSEAQSLQKLSSKLSSRRFQIISYKDFSQFYPGKTYDDVHAFNFVINVISCTQDDAILTGGISINIPGGWTDRFYLVRMNGKWKLVARINYEVR